MRESLASALYSSLKETLSDGPVTRLHAFSKAPRLSTLLWRLKYAQDLGCFVECQRMLEREMSPRRSRAGQRLRACEQALGEWIRDQCEVCLGAGVMMIEDLKITCDGCGGLGRKRYSDQERGNTRLVQEVLGLISKFDSIPGHVMRHELELQKR